MAKSWSITILEFININEGIQLDDDVNTKLWYLASTAHVARVAARGVQEGIVWSAS